MNKQEILAQLCDDSHYYGEFGSKYLSNSVIGILLSNPQMFGHKREDDKALALGRLFHQLLLEPDKAEVSMESVRGCGLAQHEGLQGVLSRSTKSPSLCCVRRSMNLLL